ncbi:MAG TPA: hypothetical protein VEI97_09415 [bacterium]|nr:hypothetical protein [bacterium]
MFHRPALLVAVLAVWPAVAAVAHPTDQPGALPMSPRQAAKSTAWKIRPASDPLGFSVHLEPAQPTAGEPFWLSYRFTTATGTPPDLAVSHEHLSHLIVVSEDLAYFNHVHPEQVAPGKFMIQLALPAGGKYILYADATPASQHPIVKQVELTVRGAPADKSPLVATPAMQTQPPYSAHLVLDPDPLKAGGGMVTFHLLKDGQPASDIRPYLGAGGHLVVISADTTEFLHAHPVEAGAMAGGDHAAHSGHAGASPAPRSEVAFHVEFPHPGLYKAWGQFLGAQGVVTFPYVIEVR